MKNLFFIIVIFLMNSLNCMAQEKLTGTLPSWDKGKADIVMGMAGPPFIIGSIDQNGTFNIPLTDDIMQKTEEAMEEYNKSSSRGRFRLNTIKKAFSCFGGDSPEVENGDQTAVTLATMGAISVASLEQKKMYGNFMAADSKAFADAFGSFGEKDAVKGFYLNWYYVKEPVSVNGECSTDTYAMNQKDVYKEVTIYNLDFEKGWNIVKISLNNTFTDSDDKTYASNWSYQTVKDTPEKTQYIFFAEE